MARSTRTALPPPMPGRPRWHPFIVASVVASCAGSHHFRETRADNARADDPWLEGERCTPETRDDPGVRVEQVEEGVGRPVGDGETVRVHYVARLPSGETVHDTRAGCLPIEIIIGSTHTICGFEKALLGMRAGEQRRAYVPWHLAFGENGRPPDIQPRTDLVFLINLYLPADVVLEPHSGPTRPPVGGGGGRRR
jgi:FKBP-type peptidyl-prolyl cis-trans isomerase